MMKTDLVSLQKTIGYQFKDEELLKEALMHRSFSAEHQIKYDNQRLEFLGDAVLQILLSLALYERYPLCDEGMLTKLRSALANQGSLAELGNRIELGPNIMLGHGEIEMGGYARESTVSDAMEALIGAVMLDSDLKTVQKVFLPLICEAWPEPDKLLADLNPKGTFQEICQKHCGKQPVYTVESVTGPDHHPTFTVKVSLNGRDLCEGQAASRKLAEMNAARKALANINTIFPEGSSK